MNRPSPWWSRRYLMPLWRELALWILVGTCVVLRGASHVEVSLDAFLP